MSLNLNRMNKISCGTRTFAVCVAIGLILSCAENRIPEDQIVARVGSRIITVDEFRRNYEFGFPNLKKGPDRKRSYLNFMIDEKLLALEGFRQGLDKSERVQQLEKELLDELLIEEHFKSEVNSKITVTPEEIREAITRSSVGWKLRYWAEPNLKYASSVSQAMKKQGYAKVVDEILKNNPELNLRPEEFETDYLSWTDVSPEMLDAIKDCPIGEISDPIEMNGVYFIFQIVDIQRGPLSDYDYDSRASSMRQTLFYRKLEAEAAKYVKQFMTPKNVVTKGDAFRTLANGLAEWKKKIAAGREIHRGHQCGNAGRFSAVCA